MKLPSSHKASSKLNQRSSPSMVANSAFTIVELLIVIVVIGILASISIVAYNGIQQRARDSQRVGDIASIHKALELYYIDNGEFPAGSGSSTINSSWSTTADNSWSNLESALVPKYMSSLPKDPVSAPGRNPQGNDNSNLNYAYFSNSSNYCGAQPRKMYILIYKFESRPKTDKLEGECNTNVLTYSASSSVRVVKE